MSGGGPHLRDWSLNNPDIVTVIWNRIDKAEVVLFAAHDNARGPLWFSLTAWDAPSLGVDAFAHQTWSRELHYVLHQSCWSLNC